WLTPTASAQASYGPVVFLLVIAAVFGLTFLTVRHVYHGRLRRADPLGCGFPEQTARLQGTARAFRQPLPPLFRPLFPLQPRRPRARRPRGRLSHNRGGTTMGGPCPCRSRAAPRGSRA